MSSSFDVEVLMGIRVPRINSGIEKFSLSM